MWKRNLFLSEFIGILNKFHSQTQSLIFNFLFIITIADLNLISLFLIEFFSYERSKIWMIAWHWVRKLLQQGFYPRITELNVFIGFWIKHCIKWILYKYLKNILLHRKFLEKLPPPCAIIVLRLPVASSKRFERHFIWKQFCQRLVCILSSLLCFNYY